MEEDKTYIAALLAAPSTGADRMLSEAVAQAWPRFNETIRAFRAMFAPLVDWFQNTLKPAMKLIAETLVRAMTPGVISADQRRRRGYTTRQLRMAARRIVRARRCQLA